MSNKWLDGAMKTLKSAGAKGLPSKQVVMSANDEQSWTGKKSDGSPWQLIKNSETSYNSIC